MPAKMDILDTIRLELDMAVGDITSARSYLMDGVPTAEAFINIAIGRLQLAKSSLAKI